MEDKKIFELICYLHRQMSRENNILFSEYKLSHVQLHVLFYVDKCVKTGENVCQRDIEKQLNLRPSSVSTLLSNLEKEGFIVRTVSDGDARTKYIRLTESGLNICDKNKLLIDDYDKAIRSSLNDEEQKALRNLLTKIIDSLNKRKEVKG